MRSSPGFLSRPHLARHREGLQPSRALPASHRPSWRGVLASSSWQPYESPLRHYRLCCIPGETEAQRRKPLSSGLPWLPGFAAGTNSQPLAKSCKALWGLCIAALRLGQISSHLVAFARLGSPPAKAQGDLRPTPPTPITGSQTQAWEGLQRARSGIRQGLSPASPHPSS